MTTEKPVEGGQRRPLPDLERELLARIHAYNTATDIKTDEDSAAHGEPIRELEDAITDAPARSLVDVAVKLRLLRANGLINETQGSQTDLIESALEFVEREVRS